MSDLFDAYTWACFEPRLRVCGVHSRQAMPVAAALRSAFEAQHPRELEQVLAQPHGFDGRRAALKHWSHSPGQLRLHTGERSYTASRLMARLIQDSGALPYSAQPDPAWSWGIALASLVLLPGRKVLAGKRAGHLRSAPGRWATVFTEVLEPSDISPLGMDAALSRLAAEELAPLQQLGRHHFVGLIHLSVSRQWILVAVLDLREVPPSRLDRALAELAPDQETVDWATLALGQAHRPMGLDVIGMRLARDVQARLAAP